MENLVRRNSDFSFRGRRVLVTGHTGFKGAWLCEWLIGQGAKVFGIALPPESEEALFVSLRLEERLSHIECDIRDAGELSEAVRRCDPEIVFHLAAQSLVRRSYREPLLTWQTNVDGTLNLLEATRKIANAQTIIVVTSDKVYKNREWEYGYREDDELGGHDPYSASKAACEIAVVSWRASFGSEAGIKVATARAGNVLGAGDIAEDRIVPDCYRAWNTGRSVNIRNPSATRPWQHVLNPLSGYLLLAGHIHGGGGSFETCNFGPDFDGHRTVSTLVSRLASCGPDRRWGLEPSEGGHESRLLALSIDRARGSLGWRPILDFEETVKWTNEGYSAPADSLPSIIERQLSDFAARTGDL